MHVTAVNVSLTTADQFERAVTPVMPSLIGYARRLSKNAADTDDLVQDTLLKAWAARLGFRTGSNVKAWLIRIARNTFLSNLRCAGRQVLWEAEDIARALVSDNDQESALMLGDLANAISRLSAPQRFAFELIVENGLSYEEASQRSGIDIGTIKSQVSRARTRLVQEMDGSPMPRSEVVPVKTVTRVKQGRSKQTTFAHWKKSGCNLIG